VLDRLGVIQLSKEFGRKSILKFLVPSNVLLQQFEKNVSFSVVGKTILRMYGGIFDSANAINLGLVANKMGGTVEKVIAVLKEMEQQDLIELKLHQTDASITFLVPREDDKTINPLRDEIERSKEKKGAQVATVLKYIEDTSQCKQLLLVAYFGEKNNEPCGVCSYCMAKNTSEEKNNAVDISDKIIKLLNESPFDSRSIIEKLNFAESDILDVLQLLLDKGDIRLNVVNQYFVK